MAKNDVVLLDSLIDKARARFPAVSDDSELFELVCFDQLLKQHEPSVDELESGWTDGGNDGGIDGFFVYVDDRVATPNVSDYALRRNPTIDVYVVSAKRAPRFEQQPIDSLISSLGELLDLTLTNRQLSYPYNESVLVQRDLFKSIFVALADRQPLLKIKVIYASRSATSTPAPNIQARAEVLNRSLRELFSNAEIDVLFVGAPDLLALFRKGFDYKIRLRLAEVPIAREGSSFVLLCTLPDYFRAICDESGALKRYLFDSNVRDYLGNVQVNADIIATLRRADPPSQGDFWWLNNGITILATDAWIMAKEILVENAQIVNGLQTTETLFKYFIGGGSLDDARTILVKVIAAADDDARARIIKATNYQNAIELAHLRGLDKVQRDIEAFLLDFGWFYDRQKNAYKNQGRPADRIISIPYLAAAVRAIALGDPAGSPRQRSRSLRDDETYHAVFDRSWDLRVYLTCVEIARAVERGIHSHRSVWDSPPMALSHFIGFVYVCECLGKFPYESEDVISLVDKPPSREVVIRIRDELSVASKPMPSRQRRFHGVLLERKFIESYVKLKLTVPLADVSGT